MDAGNTHSSLTHTSTTLKVTARASYRHYRASGKHEPSNTQARRSIMQQSATNTDIGRNLIILPTSHEDVLRLKDKLSSFSNRQWQVQDFGAFGTFELGFILIEIDSLQGYHNFKRDICSLAQQGLKYAYPEHAVCWLSVKPEIHS